MPVVVTLLAEFPGHEMTVIRIVAEYTEEHPEADVQTVEAASRDRLNGLFVNKNHHNTAN